MKLSTTLLATAMLVVGAIGGANAEPASPAGNEPAAQPTAVSSPGDPRQRLYRDRDSRWKEYAGHRRQNDPMLQWNEQRREAMQRWSDFRNEDWKRYLAARRFWNNPWGETQRYWSQQRSDTIRKQMDEMREQRPGWRELPAPPGGLPGPWGYPWTY